MKEISSTSRRARAKAIQRAPRSISVALEVLVANPDDADLWRKASTALVAYSAPDRAKPMQEALPVALLASALALRPAERDASPFVRYSARRALGWPTREDGVTGAEPLGRRV